MAANDQTVTIQESFSVMLPRRQHSLEDKNRRGPDCLHTFSSEQEEIQRRQMKTFSKVAPAITRKVSDPEDFDHELAILEELVYQQQRQS